MVVALSFLLQSCAIGPTLFSMGGYSVTLGSVVSIPIKNKIVDELKEEESSHNEEGKDNNNK